LIPRILLLVLFLFLLHLVLLLHTVQPPPKSSTSTQFVALDALGVRTALALPEELCVGSCVDSR
jgi:hypothetical protein